MTHDGVTMELQRMWTEAGQPTSRAIAGVAGISHTTVAQALSGLIVPTLTTTLRIVEALEGDRDLIAHLYEQPGVTPYRPPTVRELLVDIRADLRAIREHMIGPVA